MRPDEYERYVRFLSQGSSLDDVRQQIAGEGVMSSNTIGSQYHVTLRTYSKQYLTAEDGGGREVLANRNAPGPWETFRLVDLNGGILQSGDDIYLVAYNGMFVVAEGGGVVNANSQRASHRERFTLLKVGGSIGVRIRSGDTIALLARNGQYVVAEGGGGSIVNANRPTVGPWEQFTIHMPDAAPLEALYQAVLGRSIDDSDYAIYSNALAHGWSLTDVRSEIAHSQETQGRLAAAYQAIWGRPIGQDYLEYYTFLLGLPDRTLADIVQDEKERYLQTVVLPVLIAVSILQ